ncbi:MAG: pseudouridine synthase [Phycisphaerales bacterium]
MRRRGKPTHSFQDDSRGPRLQRVLADAGVGSRRHCEELVEQGSVIVNGEVIDGLPAWVDPDNDRIEVEGRPLRPSQRHVYVMLFKPKGVVTTNDDPEGRTRAVDLVRHPSGARLYPVGRLDMDSSGLLLLTNDGELANRLTHPRYEVHKVYEVTVGGTVAEDALEELRRGIWLPERERDGARTSRSSLEVLERDRTRTLLRMELREGRNRQIRRMMLSLGHPVKKLRRIAMGPLRLKGVAMGEWRDLTAQEVDQLRKAAFATPAERMARAAREPRGTAGSSGGAAAPRERRSRGARDFARTSRKDLRYRGRGPGEHPSRGGR